MPPKSVGKNYGNVPSALCLKKEILLSVLYSANKGRFLLG